MSTPRLSSLWLALWIAGAACARPDAPPQQNRVTTPAPAQGPPTSAATASLASPTSMNVDWPPLAHPPSPGACPTADVPFGQTCPRAALDCTLADARRVHCSCAGTEWRCLSGPPPCFAGVRAGAACSTMHGACELGNGLVFRTCSCRDARWTCTGYGL